MGRAIARIACFLSIFVGFGAKPGHSADLIWQVENPFRFFKSTRSFAMQEAAFNAVRGDRPAAGRHHLAHRAQAQRSRLQGLVLARSLRRDRGQALSAEPARLGGADASTTTATRSTASRAAIRPAATANIRGASAKEDYILPDAHTVHDPDRARAARRRHRRLRLDLAAAQAGGKTETKTARLQGQAHDCARALLAHGGASRACR